MKKKIYIFFFIILGIFFIRLVISDNNFRSLKNNIPTEIRFYVKKYFFPYKYASQLEDTLLKNKINSSINEVYFALNLEVNFKKNLKNISTSNVGSQKLTKNKTIDYYKINQGFYSGINNAVPGSGFIDLFDNKLFLLSSKGILGYSKINSEVFNFKQINNNIYNFIDFKQFSKGKWFSLKDLLVYNNKFFISYTEEIEEDCWNTSILMGEIDYTYVDFKKLFSANNCINSKNNIDKEFNAHQSGGRIVGYDDKYVLFSTGDYRSRFLAQKIDNYNGKIIKINITDGSVTILSIGHRNPQGLYLDIENSLILETEHGPKGGDEINLINLDENKIQNFGWPISSAGDHYNRYNVDKLDKYKKYPLYKSHKKYGFKEPIKFFVPSIGISEITKIKQKQYVFGSLKDKSLYFFELNEKNEFIDMERIEVLERVRDLKYHNNKLYLFLEDSPALGVISIQ